MKSHFRFTKGQRTGIFLLLIIVVLLQCAYFFIDVPQKKLLIDEARLTEYQNEIDSLRLVEIESNRPKIYPFNPNYMTDYRAYTLGMSNEEIDRLLHFRKRDKWINSAKQFQQITQVSDSLLNVISPYFKFPEWVTHPQSGSNYANYNNQPKTFAQKSDLNKASAKQLQRVNGIGEKLSERIVRFRNKFQGGFIADVQLQDIYGLSPEVIERITKLFTVKTPRPIEKIDLNSASIEKLVTIQHIDYELAYEIIDQRTLREGFSTLEELIKVKGFPVDKFEIIKLYLTL